VTESPFRLKVPGWVADGFVESGGSTRDDVHLALHVALTAPLSSWTLRTGRMLATDCPVAAVEALRRFCEAQAHVAIGATTAERQQAARWGRWANRLGSELDRLAKHPAYVGLAVRGMQTVVLPAYRAVPCGAEARWWPLPRMALDADRAGEASMVAYGLLTPVEVHLRGVEFTRWEVRPA